MKWQTVNRMACVCRPASEVEHMPGWLCSLMKFVPGIRALWQQLSGVTARAEEIRAQTEHDDIAGFYRTGRVSALHLWKYVKVGIALLLAVVFCAAVFYPAAADNVRLLLQGFAEAVSRLFAVEL